MMMLHIGISNELEWHHLNSKFEPEAEMLEITMIAKKKKIFFFFEDTLVYF